MKNGPKILPSEITDESVYLNRREFLRAAGILGASVVSATACSTEESAAGTTETRSLDPAQTITTSPYSSTETPNSYADITTYNNYYEFGTGKSDPHENAQDFVTKPWQVTVDGECDKAGVYDYDDIVGAHSLEDRIYRLRCVEAWSMVIPWVGFPLADLLSRFQPNSRAKYVQFKTLHDPLQLPGQRRSVLEWPYVEGLTIDEAMNPLTIMAVGLYGKELPNQNGAPMRLIVPWKYGFKSIKAINHITFSETQPNTSWELAASHEYGFYANVNPRVNHPRWSQAKERRIGSGLFDAKRETEMFNGYGEHVAHLYTGVDLKKNY